ncbi:MAG: MFS transporter [Dehalococcoidia bacterium]
MVIRSIAPRLPFAFSSRMLLVRDADYRRFWLAAMLDEVAGWLLFVVQGWLLIEFTARPLVVILFFLLRMLPKVLVALPAGALCDRVGPLPVLRVARLAGALPAVVILGAALTGQLSVAVLMVSAALTCIGQAFERPAHRSLIPAYAPGERMVGGVALLGTASTLSALASPLVFLAIVAVGGALWALPLQALLAIASGLILFRNRPPAKHIASVAGSVRTDCWAALRALGAAPGIIALIVLVGSPGMFDRLLTFLTPGYAQGQGEGTTGMTLLFLAPATGALIGGSLLAWIGGEVRRLLPLALGSSSVAVVSVSLLATTQLFLLSLFLFLLLGAAKAAFSVAIMAALQRRVPEEARGRMMAF